MTTLLAIDPGPEVSAMVAWEETPAEAVLLASYQVPNEQLLGALIDWLTARPGLPVACEDFVPRGQPLGKIGKDTIFWLARFFQAAVDRGSEVLLVPYGHVALHLVGMFGAKQAQINMVLTDRYGGKGTKSEPGVLYGIKEHVWSAVAVAAYFVDRQNGLVEKKL